MVDLVTAHAAGDDELTEVRSALRSATAGLLGATIQVDDDSWGGPSRLPGWSRAELAAHLARHADASRKVVEAAGRGELIPKYAPGEREAGIRAGADRTGLAIQEDLDAACGRLEDALDEVEDWTVPVLVDGGTAPVSTVPLSRLAEVVVHTVDLDIGVEFDGTDPEVAGRALDWAVGRIGARPDAPSIRLVATSGREWLLGPVESDATRVGGSPQRLLGWLAGRLGPEAVDGAAGIVLPPW